MKPDDIIINKMPRRGEIYHAEEIPINATVQKKKEILERLIEGASCSLPFGTVFEIREYLDHKGTCWIYHPPHPYTTDCSFQNDKDETIWFKHPGLTMKQSPLFMNELGKGELIEKFGYYLVGRAQVPSKARK